MNEALDWCEPARRGLCGEVSGTTLKSLEELEYCRDEDVCVARRILGSLQRMCGACGA